MGYMILKEILEVPCFRNHTMTRYEKPCHPGLQHPVKTCDSDRHGMDDRYHTHHIVGLCLLGLYPSQYKYIYINIPYICVYIYKYYIYIIYIYHVYPIYIYMCVCVFDYCWTDHGTYVFLELALAEGGGRPLESDGRLSVPKRPYEIQPLLRSLSKVSFIASWWFLDIVNYRR